MKNRFSKLEAYMEALVEGTFARLFAGRLHPRDVAVQLARALEDSALTGAPPALRYAVRLNPADAQALLGDQPRLAEKLADELVAMAREANLTLAYKPDVLILPDAAVKPRSVTVTAMASEADPTTTQGITSAPATGPLPAPPHAFLILEGERTVLLEHPVVSIGRRLDNHIILDDPRVSRAHAQLRLRFGRYVLYDLGSTGGTFVNSQRVQECVLRPGDVISLAGVSLIYGEEDYGPEPPAPRRPDADQTQPSHRISDPHRQTDLLTPPPDE
jgi:hypothetical protein